VRSVPSNGIAESAILLRVTAWLEISLVLTAPLAISERPTAPVFIFDALTASLWIFLLVTALFFSCLLPTLLRGSLATANPIPVSTRNTAIVAITLA